MALKNFTDRHIGISPEAQQEMLIKIGVSTTDELINQTIPQGILINRPLKIPAAESEYQVLKHLKELAGQNKAYASYIGFGYYNTILPSAIQRNILENTGWYTAYTPYQAEIAQGRLEALLNYQTLITDLTALPIANASLLDEGTAAAEAMSMFFGSRSRAQKKANSTKFLVANDIFPQTLAVIQPKAKALGIELVIANPFETLLDDSFFGLLLQYPNQEGIINNYQEIVSKAEELGIFIAVGSDLMALTQLTPPGEWGADVVFGTSQRFGIPLGYGGPHAAFFACKDSFKRAIPGRIIGISQDRSGKPALRMALQVREQHIKREKATSNICTAQVLLAVMAGMYAVYHGKEGLLGISTQIHQQAVRLNKALTDLGLESNQENFFDTLSISTEGFDVSAIKSAMEKAEINLNYFIDGKILIALDETTTQEGIEKIVAIFAQVMKKQAPSIGTKADSKLENFKRTSDFMSHEVFKKYHTETELMRYIKRLENKDLSLNHSMIALGSCTMKLNAASELLPLSWPEFGSVHPFVPKDQAQGFQALIKHLEDYLSECTGFHATSLQPNSGAQGEYAGLMVIKAYHESRGEGKRNVALIPASAHGTNPASAVLAGMKVIVVKNKKDGHINMDDLKQKADEHKDNLSCFMVTYPSTYGVFDEEISEITDLIHTCGGQVYMDGANMNAQVGLTNPANIGADVCHLNLHKTFAIPHGGGGPGVGPICVAKHLAPFLPTNPNISTGGANGLSAISSAPYGSALILIISYTYIKMLGAEGLKKSTETAILSANYLKVNLAEHYDVLYENHNGRVAHELIIDFRPFKSDTGIEVVDVAKRLMDYGFHSPTVSFPVVGTLMIEPTESESKEEIDRFISALINIRKEIAEIAEGKADKESNVLKNAPHTLAQLSADEWEFDYSRKKAAYPLDWVREHKFFASVNRIDDAYGDRNLICTCIPTEDYA